MKTFVRERVVSIISGERLVEPAARRKRVSP
jgi:hypothetical protein